MLDILMERAKMYVRSRPSLYFAAHRVRGRYLDVSVSRETQLVIEGFPRSGNTFAVVAFRKAQRREVNVAHHLHVPAQVIRAARWGIPCLVLVREPREAVTSLVLRHPEISPRRALIYYASFYKALLGYRDAFVVGTFEEVTADYGAVIKKVNRKFGTDFVPFEHTRDNVRSVFSSIEEIPARRGEAASEDRVARPSTVREGKKESIRELLDSPEHARLVERAAAARDAFLS
jgi:hypothetical protein